MFGWLASYCNKQRPDYVEICTFDEDEQKRMLAMFTPLELQNVRSDVT